MKKNIIAGISIGVIVVAGVLLYVSRPQPFAPSAPEPAPAEAVHESVKVKEFTITGQNFSFTPSKLIVAKGDTVKITFINTGGFHNLVIDKLGVSTKTINSGQADAVTFTATTAGTFEYYCSVGNHRAMGMRGTLVVQ